MEKHIIIGGVAAGMSAASKIRSLDPQAAITVFEKSGYVSYAGCGMPYLIAGKVPSIHNLITYDSRFFKEKRNIDVFLQHEVLKISPQLRAVLVRNLITGEKRTHPYDRLLISSGARAVVPPIKGIDLQGIFTLRKMEDVIAIQDYMARTSPGQALIIGAGSIGMEMAEAFSERGLKVNIVEKMPDILGSMDDEINKVVEEELKNKQVSLLKSKTVVEFQGDELSVKRAVLENGEQIVADIVIIGTGIKANSEIARDAGIQAGQTGAIIVNDHMQTNLPDIYAAGDCAEAYHLVYGRNVYMPLGTTANKQGRVAGENMAGRNNLFAGVTGTSVFKVFDLEVGRTGLSEKDAGREGMDYVVNVIEQFSSAPYYPGVTRIKIKLLADKKTGQFLGAQMVGREGVSKRLDVFSAALSARMTVREIADLDLSYAPPFAPVYDPVLIAAGELLKKLVGDR